MSNIEDRLQRVEALLQRIMRSDENLSNTLCCRCSEDSQGSASMGYGQVVQFCDDHRDEVVTMAQESMEKWMEYDRKQIEARMARYAEENTKPRKKRWGIV